MSIQDDLITLIDAADYAALLIRDNYENPLGECRAIWDCYDLAHALTGSDADRKPWLYLSDLFRYTDDKRAGYSNLRERVRSLLAREVRP